MSAIAPTADKPVKVLDASKKQEVTYCIPNWLRDEQIKKSITRVKGRIQPRYDPRPERVAVVGFGPSLVDTWEQVKAFDKIITCSGAHKFLVERGITPTWHVEVDPRAHKVALIGPPQKGVEYLISSTCHPAVFDHLEGFDVKLWHVFDATAEGIRVLPREEWAMTGGCDVGSRAITIAAFLGFRDIHVFGVDGSEGKTGKHAAHHPNQAKKHALTIYDGIEYKTTEGLLEAARQLWHELDQLPKVDVKFYGEGLVQHMARNYKRGKPMLEGKLADTIAFSKPELISSEYAALNETLHRDNPAYGVGGDKHAKAVLKIAESIDARSVLDYGCGKGSLGKALPFGICEYDPAVPGKTESPRPADLVVCTDVLEHVEPEKLKYVLADLSRVVRRVGYFVIHTTAAQKKLADGRNTHLIQQGRNWWEKRLRQHFGEVRAIAESPNEVRIVVGAKKRKAAA